MATRHAQWHRRTLSSAALLLACASPALANAATAWSGYAGNAQHSALSGVASQPLAGIAWQTAVDLQPQFTGHYLLIHYGSAVISSANTVVVPVKTGASGDFELQARSGVDGSLLWSASTDYRLPPLTTDWVPSYAPALTTDNRVYYAGAGGTVYFRNAVDSAGPTSSGQLAFYGLGNYTSNTALFDNNVFINTPITADNAGNIYFGFQVTSAAATPLGTTGGIARIDSAGNASWVSASNLAPGMSRAAMNAAPALSNDGNHVYVTLNNRGTDDGRIVRLDSATLAVQGMTPVLANVTEPSSASPTIGPDGDVYLGTAYGYHFRGLLTHFSADLATARTPASFGWDITPSVVPRSMVPSYTGSSSYLLLIKYNDYAGLGGTGINRMAIVDPNDQTQIDPGTGLTVMKEILSIAGVTPDDDYPGVPGAVREWCVNTAVVDPATGSVLVNSEDGRLYRWDLRTNTFTESITLTTGIGEAYTPTLIGADGKVYAINNSTLFAVGAVPEPASAASAAVGLATVLLVLHRRRRARAA